MVTGVKLQFWIENEYNVLFTGKHGVGKTSIITQAFDDAMLKWKYFSAATMDPWVDFIGVPKEVEEDGKTYLDLVRPKEFQDDTVEALFFDEYNRAHKKVRNAVMELIQFKSINGHRFKNLKIVWAAINPEDDDENKYDVEPLDPAQMDRFQIHISIPYKPSAVYFNKKYPVLGEAALDWWGQLPNDMKDEVSPRRLDYALDVFSNNGDMRDVLPRKSNVQKLLTVFEIGSTKKLLKSIIGDPLKAKEVFSDENKLTHLMPTIMSSDKNMATFLPFFPEERLVTLISGKKKILDLVVKESLNQQCFKDILNDVIKANTNKKLIRKIKNSISNCKELQGEMRATYKWSYNKKAKILKPKLQTNPNYISDLDNMDIYNTSLRESFLNSACEVPKDITPLDCMRVLTMLDDNIFKRSQKATLLRWRSKLCPLMNYLIKKIIDDPTEKHSTFQEFISAHNKTLKYLIKCITGDYSFRSKMFMTSKKNVLIKNTMIEELEDSAILPTEYDPDDLPF